MFSVLRRGCDRGDDRGPGDADQPRPRGAEEAAPDKAWRQPPHQPEDDEVRPKGLQRPQHPSGRGDKEWNEQSQTLSSITFSQPP